MASGTTKQFKKAWTDARDMSTGATFRHEAKEGWDDARGKTKERDQLKEAERIAAIPEAEGLIGDTEIDKSKMRRGRESTKVVSKRRQALGGGASLT